MSTEVEALLNRYYNLLGQNIVRSRDAVQGVKARTYSINDWFKDWAASNVESFEAALFPYLLIFPDLLHGPTLSYGPFERSNFPQTFVFASPRTTTGALTATPLTHGGSSITITPAYVDTAKKFVSFTVAAVPGSGAATYTGRILEGGLPLVSIYLTVK